MARPGATDSVSRYEQGGEVTFDIRRGGSRCVKETPCAMAGAAVGGPQPPTPRCGLSHVD